MDVSAPQEVRPADDAEALELKRAPHYIYARENTQNQPRRGHQATPFSGS